ncbi:CvpA family protein [Rhodoblastus sp.]|uniref:CvpA family protein n=1 Tax=Rhodoblastus sp. TaxID=1962975 RepID=UPI003F953747
MPSYVDLGLIAVILISALLATVRGFTREVMAIVSWAVAAAAAVYFYPMLIPKLSDPSSPIFISKAAIRPYAAGAAIFFVALIIVSIVTIRISDAVLDSRIGALDRSLGFLFGAVRGLLLCAIAFIFFNWLAPEASNATSNSASAFRKQWLDNARSLPLLKATSDQLLSLLPDDPDGLISKFKKSKPAGTEEAPPPESDSEPKAAPATPSPPAPPPRPDNPAAAPSGPTPGDKQKLDGILNLGH